MCVCVCVCMCVCVFMYLCMCMDVCSHLAGVIGGHDITSGGYSKKM